MLHNHTGYILTPESVALLDAALAAMRAARESVRVLVVVGFAPPSRQRITFEARLTDAGLATRG